jgi:AraC-like DNA-binding protein
MVLQEYAPHPALKEYVRTYRLVHFAFTKDGQPPFKAYPPRPEHCLTFYAQDTEQVIYQGSGTATGNMSTVLFGQQTEVTYRYVGRRFLLIQVVFTPGALYRMTGIPSTEITNQYIDAETVFSTSIKYVNEQINDCKDYREMIAVVDRFLLNQLRRRASDVHGIDVATAQVFRLGDVPTVDQLARAACQSVRQFERSFKARMGVSPKYYLKVFRFESAFRMKNLTPAKDWLSIALHCGYHDYQHLTRDYISLTRHTPRDFHEIGLTGPEREFGEIDTY